MTLTEESAANRAPEAVEHRVGEVDRHGLRVRMGQLDEREQAAVAAPQVQDPRQRRRQELEQRPLSLAPVRDGIGASQILERVRWRSPEVGTRPGHASSLRAIGAEVKLCFY